jgi:hypothetical protein
VTIRDVLASIGRRWYVFLFVMLAFAALTVAFYRDGGSYFTHTSVTFTLPERSALLPESGTGDLSVIAFAGAVATTINQGKPIQSYSSADAPYYGAGVREGVMVSLRNDGNQWISSFPSATIDIQIVGRTKEWVQERQTAILDDIMNVAHGQQNATTTPASAQITATVQPLTTEIGQVQSGRPTQLLAIGAMAVAGLIVAAPAAVAVDRLVRRRRRRAARRVVAPLPRTVQAGGLSG